MKTNITVLLTIAVCVSSACALAEDIELFRASKMGDAAWVWGGARLKEKGGQLVIKEHNSDAAYGDVFMADKSPYFKDALVDLNIEDCSGALTPQAVAFEGDKYLASYDLAAQIAEPGSYTFDFKDSELPAETETILFKFWIGGEEGAYAAIRDLVYRLPITDEDVLIKERFEKKDAWETQDTLLGIAVAGAKLSIQPGKPYGAMLYMPLISKEEGTMLLLDAPMVQNGNISMQLVAFDDIGEYLRSIDVLKEVGPGMHVVDIDKVSWPPQAEQYRVKLWIGGQPNATALLNRLMLIRR